MRQKEEKLSENVYRRFKMKGIPIDKKNVEKAILHPPNIAKKQIDTKRSELDGEDFVNTGEPGIIYRRKKKEMKKRSESTNVRGLIYSFSLTSTIV